MDIWELDKLILFLTFFIPGFVSIKIYDLLVAGQRRDFSKSVFEVIAFSAINFALFFWLIDIIIQPGFKESNPFYFYSSIVLLFIVLPSIWPFLYIKLYNWKWFAKHIIDPHPTAWDYQFSKGKTYWVIVHLKDKRKIGGLFGLDSYASNYPNKQQIYLQEVWEIDDDGIFKNKINQTKGILILDSEIIAIEFFN